MRTAQRKAKEVAERDQKLVNLTLEMISRDGFHNLTLGRLAEEAGYSKGTIYNHFTCREDLLIELSAESARRQLRYFNAVVELPLSSVRTLYGLAMAYMRHAEVAPVLFECTVTARTGAVCRAASSVRLERRDLLESQMAQLIGSVVDRVAAEGGYAAGQIPTAVAIDALRAFVLGDGVMRLRATGGRWAGERDLATGLAVLAALMSGLGFPLLTRSELMATHREIAGVVDAIAGEYPMNGM